jgi:dipeptidyl aminopeptidase/acylaminoacyl peptidase
MSNSKSTNTFASVLFITFAIILFWIAFVLTPSSYHTFRFILPTREQIEHIPSIISVPKTSEMTLKASKFTPEVLLSAPRRSAALPNADGTRALYTVSTYSFESHSKTKEIRILDLSTTESLLVISDEKASEPHWLEEDILYLRESSKKGQTELVVVFAADTTNTYVAATIPGPFSDLKLKTLEKGKVAVIGASKAARDGSMFNPDDQPKKHHTGLVYDSLMVRHWDKYVTPNKNALFYGILQKSRPHITESSGRYTLGRLHNVLKGTHLESPISPFPSSGHYDLSTTGILFMAKDPTVDPALNTKTNVYYVPTSFDGKEVKPQKIQVEGLNGATSSPVFAPNGQSAAFLQMPENGYEADKNRLVMIADLKNLDAATELMKSNDGKGLWDRSPSSILWANDGRSLYLTAEDTGRELLWKLEVPATPLDINKIPTKITTMGGVSEVHTLGTGQHLLLSGSTLTDNSMYLDIDPANPDATLLISSNSKNGSSLGLSRSQVSEIWFDGARGYRIHAWVIKPSHFDKSKKYPLAYLIHGGPQGAWADSWSTRWNPAIYAEQGYVVVTPNPTGSTSYGQALTDGIRNDWGGRPYDDLVNGFEYIEKNMDYVDTARAVALGASYGGYMMNWFNGHDLGRKFKALVCHDGVFSMANQQSSDEQYFPNHDLGGPFWKFPENWDRWDPSRHTDKWETPMLVIHNELDYRLPISEGLAAFNVLQTRKVPSRFLTFPDENHWVLKEENSLLWHTVVLNWINKYVGLPAFKEESQQGFEVQSVPLEE